MNTVAEKPAVTLADIRAAAERLSNAHNDTAATAAHLNAEIKAAIAPILSRYRGTLDVYAAAEAAAYANLDNLLAASPHLFAGKPRSLSVDGVRAGFKKAEDSFDWSDEAVVIAAIKSLKPALAPILIRTSESLVKDAVGGIDDKDRIALGIRTITGVDQRFITIGDNDAEKLAQLVIADASRRQGEEDSTRAKTGKVKAKVAA